MNQQLPNIKLLDYPSLFITLIDSTQTKFVHLSLVSHIRSGIEIEDSILLTAIEQFHSFEALP